MKLVRNSGNDRLMKITYPSNRVNTNPQSPVPLLRTATPTKFAVMG